MSNPGSYQPSRVVKGRVISGQELRDYAERHGLCIICAQYQTHERKGTWMRSRFEPMTVTNSQGVITVYKGHCIQPTCYPSVEFVKEKLGEIPAKKRKTARASVSGGPLPVRQLPPSQPPTRTGFPTAPTSMQQSPRPSHYQPGVVSNGVRHSGSEQQIIGGVSGGFQSGHRADHAGSVSNSVAQNSTINRGSGLGFRPDDDSTSRSYGTRVSEANSEIPFNPYNSQQQQRQQQQQQNSRHGYRPSNQPVTQQGGRHEGIGDGTTNGSVFGASASDHLNYNGSNHNPNGAPMTLDHRGSNNWSDRDGERKEEEETDPEIDALNSQLADGDYIGFLNRLDNQSIDHRIALEGLHLFRKWVYHDQMEKPDGVVLGFDGWVKTIKTLVEQRFPNDKDIAVSGLATLLTFSTLPGNYKKYMIKKGGIDFLFKMIEENNNDNEELANLSCATMASMTKNEKEGMSARHDSSANVIRKLVHIVASEDVKFGKEYALLSLGHLASQRRKTQTTGKTLANDIKIRLLEKENSIPEIIKIIQIRECNARVAEAGLEIFWRLSYPKEDETEALPPSKELFDSIAFSLENFQYAGVHEASCGLIANMALCKQFPAEITPKIMQGICTALSQENIDEGLAVCGTHAFCNLLSNAQSKSRVVSNPNLIPVTLAAMKKYPSNEDLMEFGCLTIAQATRDNPQMKELVVSKGGFGIVHRAMEQFVTLRGADPSLVIKDAALCALAAISGCNAGSQELKNSGMLDNLQAMFAVETDEDFRCILQAILHNSQNVTSNGGFSPSRRSVLSSEPQMFVQVIGSATSDNAVFSLIEELQEMGSACLPALGDRGFDTLLSVMSNFRNASLVQEKGCAILAQAYGGLPFRGMKTPVPLPNGSFAVIHKVEAFETLHRAMNLHRRDAGVQHYACLAIYNYVAALYGNEQALREVSRWITPFFKEVCEAINNNPDDDNVLKSGFSLFWVLSMVQNQNEAGQWRLPVLQALFDSVNRQAGDPELIDVALNVLIGCENDMESMEFIGNSGGTNFLFSMLGNRDSEVVGRASHMLLSLLKTVFVAISQVSQMPHAPRTLAGCMNMHRDNPHIQFSICSILEALFNFGEFFAGGSETENLLVRELCAAATMPNAGGGLPEKACRVLSLLIPSLQPEVIDPMRNVLGPTFAKVLADNMENPEAEAAAMDALCMCCDQHDYFKHILSNDTSMRQIIQAMTLHLGCLDLQRSGCSLLWILSGYGHGRQMIGEFGGVEAVVNAMLAHNQSTVVQKEGLMALKNLATASVNKKIINTSGGEDAVQYALWIHYREPQVISVALSALNNIAVDSETKSVATMRENMLDIVIGAMKRYPKNENVQKNSCFYLKSCSYSHANLAMMYNNRIELSQVLQRAAATFPEGCRDRAQSVLSKLEQFR